jgi:hypothetical protein
LLLDPDHIRNADPDPANVKSSVLRILRSIYKRRFSIFLAEMAFCAKNRKEKKIRKKKKQKNKVPKLFYQNRSMWAKKNL